MSSTWLTIEINNGLLEFFYLSLLQLDANLIEGELYNRLAQKIQRRLKWRVEI